MHIPEKYRDRYDRLAASHPWMREMRDETNGISGETNGNHADAPLGDEPPSGDSLEMLKDWIDAQKYMMESLRDTSRYKAEQATVAGDESMRRAVVGWLDRQKAITERETIDRWDMKAALRIAELQSAYDGLVSIAAKLCRACGFTMVDASGEAVG